MALDKEFKKNSFTLKDQLHNAFYDSFVLEKLFKLVDNKVVVVVAVVLTTFLDYNGL